MILFLKSGYGHCLFLLVKGSFQKQETNEHDPNYKCK